MHSLDVNLLLRAYAAGVFPMSDSRDAGEVFWVEPHRRGILPLDGFHLSRSLAKTIRSGRFEVTVDAAFAAVIAACAEARPDRPKTWINRQIEDACLTLHRRGHAHSVEVWLDGRLVGGLYGIALGGAFFGESMFSRARDASKVALAYLVARMKAGGYALLDCQFITDHLASLGAIEVTRETYVSLLDSALGLGAGAGDASAAAAPDFFALEALPDPLRTTSVSGPASGKLIVQLLDQTS
ncbi:leucyl/phenylalanyl-tRNA--protein transferase [Sphingomonas zeicaulis]|uniref:leucyl/phenylalanyl-tRNA--protein transferase n=1 Tax=Sphingomonas zeicaulis TaxID=1632740 RepID=UPI003D1D0D82